jgi:CobQ-like glutamine amidotransferase family enzyme
MKLKFASLFPGHLDLNGDQANLRVAAKRLQWFGHQVDFVSVNRGEKIPSDSALVFLGHGSIAAWSDIEGDLANLMPQIKSLISNGAAFMAVSTGHERAIEYGLLPGKVEKVQRISKFEITTFDGLEILGYLNSETTAPVFQKQGLLLGTQLHGPLFAKNPLLVDTYLAEILNQGSAISFELKPVGFKEKSNADQVAGIVEEVWKLERELASE